MPPTHGDDSAYGVLLHQTLRKALEDLNGQQQALLQRVARP